VHEQIPCTGSGDTGTSLAFDGTQHVDFPCPFPLNFPGDATVAFWIKTPFNAHQAVIWGNGTGIDGNTFQLYVNPDSTFDFNYREPNGTLHFNCCPSGGIPVSPNTWTHLLLSRQGDTYRLYKNGILARTTVDQNPNLPTSDGWGISGRPGYRFTGLIDDLRFYDSAITPGEIFGDPTFVSQSASETICPVGIAPFSVTASGTGPFTYQWQLGDPAGTWTNLFDGPNLLDGDRQIIVSGAMTSQVTCAVSGWGSSGTAGANFRCIVSNACGSATSDIATLTVREGGYANCDASTGSPALTAADFSCFLSKFRAGDPYANCDGSTGSPTLTAADFVCFLSAFRAGCP
jgi:hypothetical protein